MKKKKVNLAIIVVLALIILLITGYTFSKFSQSIKGKGTVKLAPWVFNVTTNEGKPISEITLKTADSDTIYPGSSGSFDIVVDGTGSDLDIVYHTVVTNENLPENMVFSVPGCGNYEDITTLLKDKIKGTLDSSNNKKVTHTVTWSWPSNGTNGMDDFSGDYSFDVEVIGEQK